MANIILGYNNRVDAATLSDGTWSATLPRVNLQNRLVSKVARTTTDSIAAATINVDLGAAYAIGAVALIVHNISAAGLVRVRGNSATDMTSPLYDSGWVDVWPANAISVDLREWENDNFWTGTLTAAARAGFTVPFINLNPARTVARYWRIEVDDTANADGYIQIGRLFIADTWTPAINYSYGAGVFYEDPTQIATSVGGEEFFDQRTKFRIMRLRLAYMTEDEAYQQALEIQRLGGSSGELIVMPDPDDLVNGFRRNFVGRLRSLSQVTIDPSGRFGVDLEIKELI